ncbi:hypothetical protein E2974_15990 [Paracoccus yeei]|uniref:hypothetical protein n=1 Tax=Paracoccus yeei TaxID=147645 RepID=UPI0037D5D2C5
MLKRASLTIAVVITLFSTDISQAQSYQEMMDAGALVAWTHYCNLTPTASTERIIQRAVAKSEADQSAALAFGMGTGAGQKQFMDAQSQGRDFCAESAREVKRSAAAGKLFLEW